SAVPLERKQLAPAGRLPHFGSPIETASDNPPAVRGKSRRKNLSAAFLGIRGRDSRRNLIAVPLEREQFPAPGHLPHFGCPILTASHNPLAVRGKGNRINRTAVPLERE